MLKQKTVLVAILVAFMLVSNSMSVFHIPWGMRYYGVMGATLVFLFLEKIGKINAPMFLLYIFSALSIAVNDVPTFFKAWQRLGFFIMITAIISPAFMTEKAIQFKTQMLATVSLLLSIVTVISIGLLLTGGGYNIARHDPYFRGAMGHSMLMGAVASISNLYILYQLQYPQKKWAKYSYYALIVGGMICVMKTGSRASLIGCIISIMAFFYFRYRDQFIAVVRRYIVYISLAAITAPLWMVYMDNMNSKNKGDTGLNTDSRTEHWRQRLIEWESSPFIGIGFSTVDVEANSGATFDILEGRVETGSSWLCALSMTGILGFSCLLIIFVGAIKKGIKIMETSPAIGSFLLSIVIFFIFHMMAEGYIFAGGNFLNTILWMTLGTIYSIPYMPEYGPILEKKLRISIKKIHIPGIKLGD